MTIDLDLVIHRYGPRGVQRTVLHELGHVVDHALLTDDVIAALDAGIPPDGAARTASSAPAPTARSASPRASPSGRSGDIGVNLDIGYKVPPPAAPLDVWGEPLARLAAG